MKCNQKNCDDEATHRVFWPGTSPPPEMCKKHAQQAIGIANAMGLTIHVEEKV